MNRINRRERLTRFPLLIVLALLALLGLLVAKAAQAADDYLPPEQAFQLSGRMVDAQTLALSYRIADGYYMYRDRFHFSAEGATLGQPQFPAGKRKYDENFQKEVETYHQSVTVRIPVSGEVKDFVVLAVSQGCADKGLCYPPMTLKLAMSAQAIDQSVSPAGADGASQSAGGSDIDGIAAVLKGGKLWRILSLFFVLGIGLAFTPCVLPMLPILSSIIVGQQPATGGGRGRSFLLSLDYSLGMILIYTALGVVAGMLGEGLSAYLQNPWVLAAFALLMAGLALSMFDLYTLQVPASLQSRLSTASGGGSGKWLGVFVMGAISALIVGPCVAAPLAGALLYISQTGDVLLGGSALFAMAAGMSVPLLLIGASAGALLPRAGAWMDAVKRFFGVLMLGTALWMVAPVIPAWLQVAGWAVLGIGYGAFLLWTRPAGWMSRALGLAVVTLGLLQLVSVATGGRDPLTPLSHLRGQAVATGATDFVRIRSSTELDAALQQNAAGERRPVMLDFYADWCVSCKEMERFTFSDPRVKERFGQMLLLQIDVTANNADDRAMLKRFKLFGPPGIMFFDGDGRELTSRRVIGYQDADRFISTLQNL
ncbi:thiol:disulfide interchange protein [Herbaspirillum rubrisubalbicans]|uniref:Thiol:disulfide interchange protein DsbD n=1 Tax=Herbaspirillum rubrisubalbicans TaxID=80842 RepID=A0ABX9BUW2_9BURK|nr:protein-disulfide reductase DsbD [Herbaspirillum rubrisubalbicans]RAM61576.1 thiol:disulfide interchange protein [Herbaspirillum rubrisubalbicans]RAN42960.1 thiol:disulfide interchange protein [Herbaspirillum rubrisubalbicans]